MTADKNLSMTPDNDKAPQRRKRPRKGPIIGFLLLLFLLAGIGAGAWWYLFLRFEESTDDAYVAGNVLRIMPQVGGKVVSVDVEDVYKRQDQSQVVGAFENNIGDGIAIWAPHTFIVQEKGGVVFAGDIVH